MKQFEGKEEMKIGISVFWILMAMWLLGVSPEARMVFIKAMMFILVVWVAGRLLAGKFGTETAINPTSELDDARGPAEGRENY